MLRLNRIFASSLAILFVAGAMAPASANAAQFGRILHLHPGASHAQDSRVSFVAYNKGPIFQDVKIGGTFYTVQPHQSLMIKAPAGTPVYAESTGLGHKRGDLLFAVTPDLKDKTVSFN